MNHLITEYLERQRSIWSPTTFRSEASRIATLQKAGFPLLPPQEIFEVLIKQYKRYTVKQLFIRAAQIDNRCKLGIGFSSWMQEHPEAFRGTYTGRQSALTDAEVEQILNTPTTYSTHNAVVLMTFAGLRKAEASKVRWSDYANGFLFVDQGKGRKNRQIPLLMRHYLLLIPLGSEYIVTRPGSIDKEVKSMSVRSGIKFTPHALRAYALQKLSTKLSVRELMEFAGHSSYQTTMKYLVPNKVEMLSKVEGVW